MASKTIYEWEAANGLKWRLENNGRGNLFVVVDPDGVEREVHYPSLADAFANSIKLIRDYYDLLRRSADTLLAGDFQTEKQRSELGREIQRELGIPQEPVDTGHFVLVGDKSGVPFGCLDNPSYADVQYALKEDPGSHTVRVERDECPICHDHEA